MRVLACGTASFRMGAVWGALTLGARAAMYRQPQPAQRRRQGQRAGGPLAGQQAVLGLNCVYEPARRRRGGGASAAALPAAGVGVSRRATRMGCGGSQRGLGCCPVARGDAGGRDLRPLSNKERRLNGIMPYDSIRCVWLCFAVY